MSSDELENALFRCFFMKLCLQTFMLAGRRCTDIFLLTVTFFVKMTKFGSTFLLKVVLLKVSSSGSTKVTSQDNFPVEFRG